MRSTLLHVCCMFAVLLLPAAGIARAQNENTQEPEPTAAEEPPEVADDQPEPVPAEGDDVVVITATRTETDREEVASSISVITREEIQRRNSPFVVDLLRHVPGVNVAQSGGEGRQASVFIRGADSDHTLVLIDGVEANDPIGPNRAFDFGLLTTENIERIEIIRGPQSVLYGSDAIGGVINIITRRGTGKPTVCTSLEAGSRGTRRYTAGVNGNHDWVTYALTASRFETDGISAAGEEYGNDEEDGVISRTLSARVGVTASDLLAFDFTGRYGHVRGDLDNSGGVGGDDPNHTFETYYRHMRGQATAYLWDERWESTVGLSLTLYDRYDNNDPDPAHPLDLVRSSFESEMLKADWVNTFYLADWNTLLVGFEHERELGSSDYYSESAWGPFSTRFSEEVMRSNGYFVEDQIALADSFYATVGVRVDDHQQFGTETTYRIAPAYVIRETGTRLKGTWGTGFKAPTLYQLFSQFGNPALDPETSQSWDLGVEQSFWGERARVGVTYFNNEFNDLIDFVQTGPFTGTYMNVDEAWSRGWELTGMVRPCESVTLKGSYTRQETRDRNANDDLLRRPDNTASGDVIYTFDEGRADLGLGVVWVGEREDMDFSTWPASRTELDDYTLFNLHGAYRFNEHCEVFGRVENLLDEEYETVKGFGQPGRGFFGGVRLCW